MPSASVCRDAARVDDTRGPQTLVLAEPTRGALDAVASSWEGAVAPPPGTQETAPIIFQRENST